MQRVYTQREWRLLSWWLATQHPTDDVVFNPRLGPPIPVTRGPYIDNAPTTAPRVFHRYADALLFVAGNPSIIEASIDASPRVFGMLIHYARKFRMDPTYAQYAQRPLGLIALVYNDDPSVAMEAPWYRVRWVVYTPKLDELPPARQRFWPDGDNGLPPSLPPELSSRLDSIGIRPLS